MPQLKTKIEERIRELVPELNPCNCDNGHLFLGYGGEDNDEPEWGACPNCVIDGRYEPQYDDIHLEHILMAIQEKSLPKNGGVIFPEENQTDIPALWLVGKAISLYDLSKPFSDQSEELYLFLLNILTNQ